MIIHKKYRLVKRRTKGCKSKLALSRLRAITLEDQNGENQREVQVEECCRNEKMEAFFADMKKRSRAAA
jgi:hypothetical protein